MSFYTNTGFARTEMISWINEMVSLGRISKKWYIDNDKIFVGGNVDLSGLNLKYIPFPICHVNGHMNISDNQLSDLGNCPDYVAGDFIVDSKVHGILPKIIKGKIIKK